MILDGVGAAGGGLQQINGVNTVIWQCNPTGMFQFGQSSDATHPGLGSGIVSIVRAADKQATTESRILQVTDAADTARAASTEYSVSVFNGAVTKTYLTGALALQRENRFSGGTYAFAGASVIAQATTVSIDRQPDAGTNGTITDSYGLLTAAGVRAGFGGQLVGNLAALMLGTLAFSWTATGDANATLTASQCANPLILLTGATLTATRNLIVVNPTAAGGLYIVKNGTGGAQSVQIIGTSGTGITIATGKTAMVAWDGTNFIRLTADV